MKIDMTTAREIAARIWCDNEMRQVEMDTELAEVIALLLHTYVEKQPRSIGEAQP